MRNNSKKGIRYHNKSAMADMIKDIIIDAPPRKQKEDQPALNFGSRQKVSDNLTYHRNMSFNVGGTGGSFL